MKRFAILFLLAASAATAQNTPPEVTHMWAQQRQSTHLVDVNYSVGDLDNDDLSVSLILLTGSGTVISTCTSVTGDVGDGITPGTNKHITWDAGVDFSGQYGSDYTLKVIADDGTGTITINPEPNGINAPWAITGPNAFSLSGTGNALLTNMIEGAYVLTWGTVAGWVLPDPAVETRTLALGGAETFSGVYMPDMTSWQNRIGIYATTTGGAAFIDPAPSPGTYFYLYFILINPTEAGVPIAFVKGFEFKVTMTTGATGDFVRLMEIFPTSNINIGESHDPYDATYACLYDTPVPVTDGKVVLLTWRAKIFDNTDPYLLYLSPTVPATFAGRLAFRSAANSPIAADGSAAHYTDPVFAIGGVPWATENKTVGAIRALFR